MNSCFVLVWAHYHDTAARPLYDRSPCSGNLYLAFFLHASQTLQTFCIEDYTNGLEECVGWLKRRLLISGVQILEHSLSPLIFCLFHFTVY